MYDRIKIFLPLMLYVVINKNPKFNHKFLQQMFMRILGKLTKKYDIKPKVIIIENECVSEKDLSEITDSDYIMWTPISASQNLDYVKKYYNSIVVLENKTTYVRKISDNNPINENLSINNDFKILYLREYNDTTNDEYKLIIEPQVVTFEEILNKIKDVSE